MYRRVLWPVTLAVVILGMAATTSHAAKKTTGERVKVLLTNAGIRVEPAKPASGFTIFVVMNETNRKTGVVIYTRDPGGTPAFRYSPLITPGKGLKMDIWIYPGRAYYLKDYTSTKVVGTRRRFESRYQAVVRIPGESGFGRGPQISRNKGYITVTDQEIRTSGITSGAGRYIVTNRSSKPRGIAVSGKDVAGSPTLSYSKPIQPEQRTVLNLWLYAGKTYTIRDYTSRTIVPGKGVAFEGDFSKEISVPERVAATK